MSNLYPANTKITETLLKIKKEKKGKHNLKKRKVPYVKLVFFTDERGKQDLMVGAQNGLKQK